LESAKWLKNKVISMMEEGSYEEAIPYLERLLKTPGARPFDVYFAHFTLGEIHLEAGRWSRAQRHLEKSLDLGGADPHLLHLLGQVLCAQGKHNKARDVLERARRLKPDDAGVELSLGTCMCLQSEFEEAEEVFRRAIRGAPEIYEAYLGLAQSLMGQQRWDDARAVLEEARERFPLVLVIRQALRDLDRIDKLGELYSWMVDDDLDYLADAEEEFMRIPLDLARTAMAELKFPPEAIEGAARMWDDYIRVGESTPRVPEVWAAGLVYTFARLLDRSDISQAGLARKFEISPASVSRVFRALSAELKIRRADPRYTGSSK